MRLNPLRDLSAGVEEEQRQADRDPFPLELHMAIATSSGYFLTIVDNGGLGTPDVPIQTDRRRVGDWEKFMIEPIDRQEGTFALKTCMGNYVTAVNCGGMGGPSDASCPVHSDATWIGGWEHLVFEEQVDGTYAIRTTSGYYLTATNGGGWGETANCHPIHTGGTVLGEWETFTFRSIPALYIQPPFVYTDLCHIEGRLSTGGARRGL